MQIEKVRALIEQERQEFLEKWISLASVSGTARETEAMDRVCKLLQVFFEEEGYRCQRLKSGEGTPDVLVGTRGEGPENERILFTGHYDTVFHENEWNDAPFAADGKLRGPGVLDMKGGIMTALFTSRVLSEIGLGNYPLKVVFVGDEEIGHQGSDSVEILKKESKGMAWALNLETGFENADICIGRKGTATCVVKTHGIASHPGNAFEKGRNAVLEMAHKIEKLSKLTNLEKGISVSVGVIQGGKAANIIPDFCQAALDLRYTTMEDFELLKEQISDICRSSIVEDTRTEFYYTEMIPPFETTPGVRTLFERVRAVAEKVGQGEIMGHIRGGASDAAYIGQTGTPVLCSMGVSGAGSHSYDEYADIESLAARTMLLVYLIAEDGR